MSSLKPKPDDCNVVNFRRRTSPIPKTSEAQHEPVTLDDDPQVELGEWTFLRQLSDGTTVTIEVAGSMALSEATKIVTDIDLTSGEFGVWPRGAT